MGFWFFNGRKGKGRAERDRAFYDYVNAAGGLENLASLMQLHAKQVGAELSPAEALMVIEGWRHYGVVRQMSIGDYLNQVLKAGQHEAVRNPDQPLDLAALGLDESGSGAEQLSSPGPDRCPACHAPGIEKAEAWWRCGRCSVGGPVWFGTPCDVGLRGDISIGPGAQQDPPPSVAGQLASVEEAFHGIAQHPEADRAFSEVVFDVWVALVTGQIDIPDEDAAQAEAQAAINALGGNVRRDDNRFLRVTACSTAGWRIREAESMGGCEVPSPLAVAWAERHPNGTRSERIGLVARSVAEDDRQVGTTLAVDVGYPDPDNWVAALTFFIIFGLFQLDPDLDDLDLLFRAVLFGMALLDASEAIPGT